MPEAVMTPETDLSPQRSSGRRTLDLAAVFRHESVLPVLVSVLTFAMCAVAISTRTGLYLEADEFGLFAIGAHLSGRDWSGVTQHVGYYSFLYPLLWIAPPFLLFDDFHAAYTTALWANALLAAVIPLLGYRVAVRWGIRRVQSPVVRLVIVLCATASGPLVAYASLGLAEVQLAVLFMLSILSLMRMQERPSVANSIGLAVVGMAMYFTHQRTIGVIVALLATVLVLRIANRVRAVHVGVFLVVSATLYVLGDLMKRFFLREVWLNSATAQNNDFGGRLDRLSQLFSLETWGSIAQVAVGQIWSLSVASFLLAPLAVALAAGVVLVRVRAGWGDSSVHRVRATVKRVGRGCASELYLVAATLLTVSISVVGLMAPARLDHYFYQRYAWFLLPPLILWVLIRLAAGYVRSLRWANVVPWILVSWILLSIAAAFVAANGATLNFMRFNAIGLSMFIGDGSATDGVRVAGVAAASFVAGSGFLLVLACTHIAKSVPWAVVLVGITACGVVASGNSVAFFNRYVDASNSPIRRLAAELDDSRSISFDINDLGWWAASKWQTALPDAPLRALDVGAPAASDGYLITSLAAFFDSSNALIRGAGVGSAGGAVVVDSSAQTEVACRSGLDLLGASKSRTDDPERSGLQNDRQEGYLAFGQYLDLPPGEFTADAVLAVSSSFAPRERDSDPALRVTMAAHGGQVKLAERLFTRADISNLTDGELSMELPFVAESNLPTAELQVWVAGGVDAQVDGLTLKCPPPPTFVFSSDSDSDAMSGLGEGWSVPEAWGTWSDDAKASLHLILPEDLQGDVHVSLGVQAYVPPGHSPQRMRVLVGDTPLGEWIVGDPTTIELVVPGSAVADGALALNFELPDALSPADFGTLGDDRMLGVGLRNITLSAP